MSSLSTPHLAKHRSVASLQGTASKPKGLNQSMLPTAFQNVSPSIYGKEPAVSFREPLISSSFKRKSDISSLSVTEAPKPLIVDSEIPPTESILDGEPKTTGALAPSTSFLFGQSKPSFPTTSRDEGLTADQSALFLTPSSKIQQQAKKNLFTGTPVNLERTSTTKSATRNTLYASSYKSPTQTDPFYEITDTQLASRINEQVRESTWVTVFGFPPSKASYILKQFSKYGTILNHKITNGNFIHMQFKTRIQADKALSKNGKVFDSVLMIGVVECLEQNILLQEQREREKFEGYSKKRAYTSFVEEQSHIQEEREVDETIGFRHQLELPTQKKRKPEASTSLISKVLDYVLKF